jgi:hypothetical protein
VVPPTVAALGLVEEYEIVWLALIEPLSVAVAGAASLDVAVAVSLNDPGVPEVVSVTEIGGSAVPAVIAVAVV